MDDLNNTQTNDNIGTTRSAPSDELIAGEQALAHRTISAPTAKQKWTYQENIQLMECYFKSKPDQMGYYSRLESIYAEATGKQKSAHYLGCRARDIIRKKWLTEVEIKKIKQSTETTRDSITLENIEGRDTNLAPDRTAENSPVDANISESERIEVDANHSERTDQSEVTDTDIANRITQLRNNMKNHPIRLPALKNAKIAGLDIEIQRTNEACKHIETSDIKETNMLIYAAARTTIENVGIDIKEPATSSTRKKLPPWEYRLKKKLDELRRDSNFLTQERNHKLGPTKYKNIKRRYKIKANKSNLIEVHEKINQRIKATAAKIKRYKERVNQYRQNKLFCEDPSRLFKELNGENKGPELTITPEESISIKAFWDNIWNTPANYNKNASWIEEQNSTPDNKQNEIVLNENLLHGQLKQMQNWKSPGPDFIHNFWLKKLSAIHGRLLRHLQSALDNGTTPPFLTAGRTTLLIKDRAKGPIPSNFRPITCLPSMWKLLTGMLGKSIMSFLEENNKIPWQQKGVIPRKKGTKDHLILDKTILKNCKSRRKNLFMGYVDYKKAFDSVPHDWIIKSLARYGIAQNAINLIVNSMSNWSTNLYCQNQDLGQVSIKRGIFQGDSLSPLLFIIALFPLSELMEKDSKGFELERNIGGKINHLLFMDDVKIYAKTPKELEALIRLTHIFSSDIKMSFGLDKCKTFSIKRGVLQEGENIVIDANEIITSSTEPYKYLGVLEKDNIEHTTMKINISATYNNRVSLLAKSKLNGKNLVNAINMWAVPSVTYSFGIVNWSTANLKELDLTTRRILASNGHVQKNDDVDRFYTSRKDGGRGLTNIENQAIKQTTRLNQYLETDAEAWMKYALKEKAVSLPYNMAEVDHKKAWLDKPLHGRYCLDIQHAAHKDTWQWLSRANLKPATEGLIMAAQNQTLATNHRKHFIQRTRDSPLCRMCNERDETTNHIVSECTFLAGTEYKLRHNKICRHIHHQLLKDNGFDAPNNWWEHNPNKVEENEQVKILYDFDIQVDKQITHRRPDIIITNKAEKTTTIVDVAIPADSRIEKKEAEKISKYQDLKFELQRIWGTKVTIIPVIIGALGALPKQLPIRLDKLHTVHHMSSFQKTVLLATASILRKVLSISSDG